jgi:transcriptional regulator with GAF, ATPase, and Fis domain
MGGDSVFSKMRSFLWQGRATPPAAPWPAAAEALQQFGQHIATLPRSDDLCQRFATTLREMLGVTGVALYVEASERDVFDLATVAGTIDAPPRLPRDEVLATADAHGREARSAGGDGLPLAIDAGATAGWQLCAPLRTNGSVLGLVALGPKRSRRALDAADTTVLGIMAAQAAVGLQTARQLQQIERQQATIQHLHQRLQAETHAVRADVEAATAVAGIVGTSPALRQTLSLVERVAPTAAPVLITGETGTGKELIARAIHALSARRDGPLVSVNCPAIPPGLAESELFGHERGSFTDAVEARPGKFELADGGTIFLDEIADLAAEMQVKLLRVLQEHETQRIGSRKLRKLDLRVVAATNRDLHAAMRTQRFRDDLYYRLAAVVVHVPPLRERAADIPALASHFLEQTATAAHKPIRGFTADALDLLQHHPWPGNVRELQHVVARAVLLCPTDIIRAAHLDLPPTDSGPPCFGSMIREEKQRRIQQALAETGGNQAAAARLLGISRSNLGRLMKSLGLKQEKPAPMKNSLAQPS